MAYSWSLLFILLITLFCRDFLTFESLYNNHYNTYIILILIYKSYATYTDALEAVITEEKYY